ncbi:MAG: DMT family transporter [Candidatus Thorarchaeota archaeon]|nr:MAG: DMT family transporter [Candidatus Thorarchaeota archaeon]
MQVTPELVLGTAAGFVASAMWAISVVVYRSQSKEIRPLAISSVKMWVALAFMSIVVILPFRTSPFFVPIESMFYLALSISLGAVIGDTIYLTSQERIGVSYAFPIAMSFPILTYFLAIIFLGDVLVPSRLFGTVVTVGGLILISREQNKADEDGLSANLDPLGIALAFMTMVMFATGTVLLEIGVTGVDPVDANFVRVLFGSAEFVPLFLLARHQGMPMPTQRAAKIVAFAGLFGMAIGSLLYVWMVKLIEAAMGSVIGSTSPLFAVPISVLYLKERLTALAAVGVLATVVGVMLVVVAF